jgi:hypothetical protein
VVYPGRQEGQGVAVSGVEPIARSEHDREVVGNEERSRGNGVPFRAAVQRAKRGGEGGDGNARRAPLLEDIDGPRCSVRRSLAGMRSPT